MKRRTLQRWIIWLLPLMVLRAFVPAGFMVAAQAGELSLVFCPSVAAPYPSADASPDQSGHTDVAGVAAAHHSHAADHSDHSSAPGDHHAHHGSLGEASEHSASAANSCPFALTAVTPAPAIDFFVDQPITASHAQPFTAVLFSSSGPQRAESIRAPPPSFS